MHKTPESETHNKSNTTALAHSRQGCSLITENCTLNTASIHRQPRIHFPRPGIDPPLKFFTFLNPALTSNSNARAERDPESGWLVGEVAELPGCYTQAPDLPALEANLHEAITVYLQTADKIEPTPEFIGTLRIRVAV